MSFLLGVQPVTTGQYGAGTGQDVTLLYHPGISVHWRAWLLCLLRCVLPSPLGLTTGPPLKTGTSANMSPTMQSWGQRATPRSTLPFNHVLQDEGQTTA